MDKDKGKSVLEYLQKLPDYILRSVITDNTYDEKIKSLAAKVLAQREVK